MSDATAIQGQVLFLADGKPAKPLVATPEKIGQIAKFLKSFPLATTWNMSDEEIIEFILSPDVIGIEVENALVMFENVIPGFKSHVGFVFWDRKVAGREPLLLDVFRNMFKILNLNKIYARVPERNRVMWRMLERMHFKCEGRLREDFPLPGGGFGDTLLFGMLKKEID